MTRGANGLPAEGDLADRCRWALCAISFALSVVLAVATVAVRAENVGERRRLEREWRAVELRTVELGRVSALAIDETAPERLAGRLRRLLRAGELRAARRGPVHRPEVATWQ